jgi:PAS domain S-box-containing protein
MSLTPRPPREGKPIDVTLIGPGGGFGDLLRNCLYSDQFSVSVREPTSSVIDAVTDARPGPECVVLCDDDPSIDPLAVAAQIREHDLSLPIVLCTDDPDEYGPQAVLDAGVTSVLTRSDLTEPATVREKVCDAGRTYRRRIQDRQDSSLLETMLDRLPVHIFAKDRSTRHVRASSAWHDPKTVLGKTDAEIWPAHDSDGKTSTDDREVLDHGASIHNEEEFSPVEDGWILVSKVPWDDDGDIVGLAGLAIDITDRKQREEELQATTQLLSTIVQTSPTAIVVHDVDGTVQFWNAAAADLFGWSPDEAIREPVPPYVTDETRAEFHALVETVVEEGSIGPTGVRRRTRDGCWLDLQLSATALDKGDGEPSRIVSVLTDVTDLKERERRLTRQNDRIEQFTRVLAHDLRNPVQVIRGQLDLDRDPDPELVGRSLDRIEAIVDDVLSVARADPLVTETTDVTLAAVAQDVWNHVDAPAATLTVDRECVIEANCARLHRLLDHLFENAIEHGGRDVTITVGCLDDGFFVADDGSGIDVPDIDHVFEPGYSTEPNATGFGLNVVREIVEAHGWTIEVVEPDAGVRFEIRDVSRYDD